MRSLCCGCAKRVGVSLFTKAAVVSWICLAGTVGARAATVYVASSGSDVSDGLSWRNAKRTVTAAMATAYSGDQVWVAAGVYVERISLKSGVALYGGFAGQESTLAQRDWVRNATVLDGTGIGTGSTVTVALGGTASVRLDGLIIRNGSGYQGGGINATSSSPAIITNNIITGNTSTNGGGIYCSGSATIIANNIITANNAESGGGGVYSGSGSPTIRNNLLAGNNTNSSGGGILCNGSATISSNTFLGNAAISGGAGANLNAGTLTLSNNILAFNSTGIRKVPGATVTLTNNCVYNPAGANYTGLTAGTGDVSADPRLLSVDYGQVHLAADSPCIDAGLDDAVQGGAVDIDGQPRLQGAHVDIGADEFDGTAPTFLPTIVRVSPSGHDANNGSSWALAKLTVQAGIDAAAAAGGEVWVAAGTYNQRIALKPFAYLYGGFAGTEASREQRNWAAHPAILDGQAGGKVVTATLGFRATRIDGFVIRNGTSGVYCLLASPVIANNVITGNVGSDTGGIYSSSGSPLIVNNVIMANVTSQNGGGICCNSGAPSIVNNTISGNTAVSGAGMYFNTGSASISNNIVAFNSSGIGKNSGATPTLNNNCVYNPDGYNYSGVTAGAGDFSADPQLLAVGYGEVHLRSGSPCIDTGLDSAAQAGGWDLDGQPRNQGAHVDIGADEFDGSTPTFAPAIVHVSPTGNDANDGSTWAIAKLTVQAGIDAAAAAGGEVWVAAGTYNQAIILRPFTYLYGGFNGTESSRDQRNRLANVTTLQTTSGNDVVRVTYGYRASGIDGFVIRNGSRGVNGGSSAPTIANNLITQNTTGGISASGALILNNRITANGSYGVNCSGSTVVASNVITANVSGGVYCASGSPTITNNTVLGHTAPGISSWTGSPAIANNIVAFNASGISVSGGTPALGDNCVYNPDGLNYSGVAPGTGDISLDPRLQAADCGDAHLRADSPCVDAGLDSAALAGGLDEDGEPRLQSAHVDIGADEFAATTAAYVPAIIRVSPAGSDANSGQSWAAAKQTVQAGIDAAAVTGGEVWVAAGVYNQRITLRPWTYVYGGFAGTEASRDQRNWSAHPTILDGQAGGSVVTVQPGHRASGISGFTIRNGYTSASGGGINAIGSSPTITHNLITWNTASSAGGGVDCTTAFVTLANNVISGNKATLGGGVYCATPSPPISNNTIVGNTATTGGGIYCSGAALTAANNIVGFNSSGIYASSGAASLHTNCVFNPAGANYTGVTPGAGDITVDPQLAGWEFGQVHLAPGSPCIDVGLDSAVLAGTSDLDAEARIQGAHVDLGADEYNPAAPPFGPVIVRVSPSGDDAHDGSSWTLAKRTVQAGMDVASVAGGEIWVAAGTYPERINLRPWCFLYGGFVGTESSRDQRNWAANATILDGGAAGSVVTESLGGCTGGIDGFTIRNGKALNGAGIFCTSGSPRITHNIITGNVAASVNSLLPHGGGIYCGLGSSVISNNTIIANQADYGGGIDCGSGSPWIANNSILQNMAPTTGGGIYASASSVNATVMNNVVSGNCASSSSAGGIYCGWGTMLIANNVITGNSSAAGGGGVHLLSSASTLANNTIVGNAAPEGGGIYSTGGAATFSNNVVAFNSSGIFKGSTITPTLRNNCVYNPDGYNYSGLTAGTGDISVDPRLAVVEYGQTHLLPGSPCIDAGVDTVVQANWLDMDGQTRIRGAHVDMGADECDGTTPPFSPIIVRVSPTGDDANDGSSWASAKRTVQAGISTAAAAGGEVWVAAGTYNERIKLYAWGYLYGGFGGAESSRGDRRSALHPTILDGGAGGSVVIASFGHHTNSIDGFTIRNGNATEGGGIVCTASSPHIANNRITCNQATYRGGGIYCGSGASPLVLNNVVTGNGAGNTGGGVYLTTGAPILVNNTVAGNVASTGGGVECYNSAPTLSNNILAFNSSEIEKSGGTVSLFNNCVYNPSGQGYSGLTAGAGDISIDPQLSALAYGDVHLRDGSPCIDAGLDTAIPAGSLDIDSGSRPLGAHVDIGADEFDGTTPTFTPTVVRVTSTGNDAQDGLSWNTAKRTVQAGIDAATAVGGEVWVAAGTYNERITLRPWAYAYGGFNGTEAARDHRDWASNATVLDGGAGGSVVTAWLGHLVSGLDGFTVRNGTGTMYDSKPCGGGVYCPTASPLFANNLIISNTAAYGAGIYCRSGHPNIRGNTIAWNIASSSGGAIYTYAGSPAITGNAILNNDGGGIYSAGGVPSIVNNRITGNAVSGSGGGINCFGGSPIVSNNTITGNTAGASGAGIYTSSTGSPIISNNTLTGNSSGSGGGIHCASGLPALSNNLVAFNSSGIYKSAGTATLANNCVYNPAGANYSGLNSGAGDISVDPSLLAVAYGEVHLQAGSPCIDAGLDSAAPAGSVDLDGEPRLQGNHVDIGADEFDGAAPAPFIPAIVRVSSTGDDANDGSSWAAAKRTVQAGIEAAAFVRGEVWVAAGTYNERISLLPWAYVYGGFSGAEMSRDQRNWHSHSTVLDGGLGGSVVSALYGHRTSGLDGFVIVNGTGTVSSNVSYGGGVYCSNASPVIAHNRFVANTATNGGAIYCAKSAAEISNNILTANVAANTGAGISSDSNSTPAILNNTILGNSGSGIYCGTGAPLLVNNIVAFNAVGIAGSGGTPTLRNNCIFNPGGADYSGPQPGTGDISVDPQFSAWGMDDIHLLAGSPCIDAGDDALVQPAWTDLDGEPRIQGAHVDIGVDEFSGAVPPLSPIIIRVSTTGDDGNDGSSWALAKRTVQAGIAVASQTGGEVWVAAGIYYERINLLPWAYVYGGFAGHEARRDERGWSVNATILDGGAAGSVVSATAGNQVSCIDGFTIRNGTGALSAGTTCGGGIYCFRASPAIANNILVGNSADYGGAIYCSNSRSLIANCTIVGNAAAFHGGGIHAATATLFVSNTIVASNTAELFGGGMYASGAGSATLMNCTISGNSAAYGPGMYNAYPVNPSLANCILWGNGSTPMFNYSSTPIVTHSDVQGGWAGIGNINSDPRFARSPSPGEDGAWGTGDDDYGDLRLQAGSPCIDAGINTTVVAAGIILDRAGHLRFIDDPATADCMAAPGTCGSAPIVDLGPYEFIPAIPGDFDGDADVDLGDLAVFLSCASGSTVVSPAGCAPADLDHDNDVDQCDFGLFQRCFGGADHVVGAECIH